VSFLKFVISVRDGHCYCSPLASKSLRHWNKERIFSLGCYQ